MLCERIYLNENDKRVYIDTYITDGDEPKDAILIIPGGGYIRVCSDIEGEPVALSFLENGYNAFVLNYRVGQEQDRFPCQLLDAAAAMIYIRKNAKKLKVNPDRVFATGFSAGGHLCGSISTMFEYDEVKEAFGEDYKLVRPTASILCYPVTSLNDKSHIESFQNLLGKPESEFTDFDRKKYSLDTAVNKNSCPMYVWITAQDQLVSPLGAITLLHAIAEAGIPYTASIFPYGPHGSDTLHKDVPIVHDWRQMTFKWLKTI